MEILEVMELEPNQTLNIVLQSQPSGLQPWWYLAVGAVGVVFGAILTGFLNLLGDWLNRKRDREDNKNKLIGELKGQKGLILQYYAFYFFSFINRGYLSCRSTIHAMHEIDYAHIYSIPEEKRNREIMRLMDKAREDSIEYKGCSDCDDELKNWKEELAKSNKRLWTVIGELQNYYLNNSIYDELDIKSKDIETAMDTYAQLEQTIMDKFDSIIQEVQEITGRIPQEAYEEESKIDATLDNKWATLGERGIDILLPHINKLQHSNLLDYIKFTEAARDEVREERESVSKNLEDKIDALINLYQKKDK